MSTIFDNIVDGEVVLPVGEIEGPFTITKPCRIKGNNTTIWARTAPVLVIDTPGVTLENIRVEVTEGYESNIALLSTTGDTVVQNCEVFGRTKGFDQEDKNFDIPRMIKLGDFSANEENIFQIQVFVSNATIIKSDICGLEFSPLNLSLGYNTITIKTDKLKDKSCIYGEIIFKSDFNRRTYISGKASSNITQCIKNKSVYKAKEGLVMQTAVCAPPLSRETQSTIFSAPTSVHAGGFVDLKKGQRISINQTLGNNAKIMFNYSCMTRMEIDPYIFLLNSDGKTNSDESLVFFGNKQSIDGAVKYNEMDTSFEIDFSKVDPLIQKIDVTYSIYGDNPNNNFSKVKEPILHIYSNNVEKMRYKINDLLTETTVVAVEFYRYNSEWKINAIGSGYRNGLKQLCESFGILVIS